MIFLLVYGLFIFFGLLMGFSFIGIVILVLGSLISLIASFVFHDNSTANIVSYVCGAVAFYFFLMKEAS